jgi:hypothetical protein
MLEFSSEKNGATFTFHDIRFREYTENDGTRVILCDNAEHKRHFVLAYLDDRSHRSTVALLQFVINKGNLTGRKLRFWFFFSRYLIRWASGNSLFMSMWGCTHLGGILLINTYAGQCQLKKERKSTQSIRSPPNSQAGPTGERRPALPQMSEAQFSNLKLCLSK